MNAVSGRELDREFIQDAVQTPLMPCRVSRVLVQPSLLRKEVLAGLAEVRSKLGTPGAADRVARMASDLVGASG